MDGECSCSWGASEQARTGSLDVDTAERSRPALIIILQTSWCHRLVMKQPTYKHDNRRANSWEGGLCDMQGSVFMKQLQPQKLSRPEPTLGAGRPHRSQITGAGFCLQAVKHFRHPQQHLCFHPLQKPTAYPAAFTPPWKKQLPFTQVIKQPSVKKQVAGLHVFSGPVTFLFSVVQVKRTVIESFIH